MRRCVEIRKDVNVGGRRGNDKSRGRASEKSELLYAEKRGWRGSRRNFAFR